MIGMRRAAISPSVPHCCFHSRFRSTALSNAVRHSGGSRFLTSSETAPSPLNEAKKSAGSDLSCAATGVSPTGLYRYVSVTRKFRAVLYGTGGNLALPLAASSSSGDICSMRASVGCIVAGYCMTLVWISYTPALLSFLIALIPALNVLGSS